ncbi:MAG TPA: hypothetical protein VJU78_20215 [Chitinophagaceae bacterium]|nr:hypothetical protein [Chitinophagaceae bacterium]
MRKLWFSYFLSALFSTQTFGQVNDTIPSVTSPVILDTPLRITNLNPYFTVQVDSSLSYQLLINKDESKYYWFLRNSPVGMKISKDGLLTFKAEKSFFLSGKLKYDQEYAIKLGVQNLSNPTERIDTSVTLVFYNTEILQPKVKFTVSSTLVVEEGKPVDFGVVCESGNFPIEDILFSSSVPISDYKMVKRCDDHFSWTPPYDFVSDTDAGKERTVLLNFIGSTRFKVRDTAVVKIIVKDALNYPFAVEEHAAVISNIKYYVLQLQYVFYQLDKQVRGTKRARTGFDLTAASSALTGTILNTSSSKSSQNTGKVLPSVGVALTPIKEATAPNKSVEQNQASVIRSAIKRLNYMIEDNRLIGERDPDVTKKTVKLREELRQVRVQLVDVPVEIAPDVSEKELNDYFNSKKVNKKYRLNKKK